MSEQDNADKAAAQGNTEATTSKYSKVPAFQGCELRFSRALMAVSMVSLFGTNKHEKPLTDLSYLDLPDAYGLYSDAAGRHRRRRAIEGETDQDFNLLHDAHEAWDVLAKLERRLKDVQDVYGVHAMYAVIEGKRSIEYFVEEHPEIGETAAEMDGWCKKTGTIWSERAQAEGDPNADD